MNRNPRVDSRCGRPGGQVLTLAASGWTWHQIFVLWDYETGSLWFPGLGFPGGSDFLLCVSGPLQGKMLLATVFSARLLWKSWFRVYPDTRIMKEK